MEPKVIAQMALEIPAALPVELTQRIHDARYSGKLSDCAHAVLNLLVDDPSGPRAGRERALKIRDMQRMWIRNGAHAWDERSIKGSVKALIETHEIPIGSSRMFGYSGYFLLANSEDLEAAERPLQAEIISLARRLRAINPKSAFARHLAGQMEIEKSVEVR